MNYRHSIRDVMDLAAKKTGIEGWQAYRWSAVEGGDIVRGCVPCGVYSRGPRKGLPKWRPATPGTEREVVVLRAELDAAAETYEREECKCWHCKGEGKTVSRVSVIDGTNYRECRRCAGTGKPHNYYSASCFSLTLQPNPEGWPLILDNSAQNNGLC